MDSVSQDALEYIFATDGCDGRGRIIYDYFAASEPDKSTRRLEGDIEEVDK